MGKQLTDKDATRIGKAISKLLGTDTTFMLIIRDEEQSTLANITNFNNRYEILGILETTKADFIEKTIKKINEQP
jgi:hypothetical protein